MNAPDGRIPFRRFAGTRQPIKVAIGSSELVKIGADRYDWRDPYHIAVTLSWPAFFAALLGVEVVINLVFACFYASAPGSIANARPGSVVDAFFFSIETLATVGYGVMAPQTLYGHVVSAIEIVCGMTFTAVVTGLVFVRFSKARARLLYADHPVVAREDGVPTLMIRLANPRATLLANATAKLHALLPVRTEEGREYRRMTELKLERDSMPVFALAWTIMHRIDGTSPLAGLGPDSLELAESQIYVFVEARETATGGTVSDLRTFPGATIMWNTAYQDVVRRENGRTQVDLTRLSLVEPDDQRQ